MNRMPLLLLIALAAGGPALSMVRAQNPACLTCQDGRYISPGTETWADGFGGPVPRCGPVLEDIPHWNLYWFNCASRVENCDHIVPELMSRRPTWYSSAEFIPLTRDTQNSGPVATFGADAGAAAGSVALGTDDFDDEFAGGGRFLIGRQLGEWYRLEVSYLGAYEYEDEVAFRDATLNAQGGTGSLTSPFTGFGDPETPGYDFNGFVGIGFESEFNSLEFNLRRKIALPTHGVEASFLLGGRYMQLDEQFGYAALANTPLPQGASNELRVRTENEMIGVQLGMLLQFYQTSRAWIDLELKGGIFENMAAQDTLYTNIDENGVTTEFTGAADEMRTAFAGEILLAANYNFSRTLTLRLGYQATAISGVALADENFEDNVSVLTLGPAQLDHEGDVVYHGPVIGLTWVR